MTLPARFRDDRILQEFVEHYLRNYLFEGDKGHHAPTEAEYMMLLDACIGFASELLGDEYETFYNESEK